MGRGSCRVAPAPVFPGSLSFFPSRPRAPKRRLPARLSRSRQRSVTRLHDPLREGPETLVDFLNLAAKYPGTFKGPPCRVYPFVFNDTATTDTYTLSLHDALPI